MKQYSATNIKNVALAGHSDEGKTTLAEAMLHVAGASDRLGRVADGNTVLDFDPEEKKRLASVSTACAPLEWRIDKINLIDTPGLFDFAGGVSEGLRAADTVLIVLSGKSGVTVGTEKAYKAATKQKKAKMFFVSHMDSEHADFKRTLDQLVENFGPTVCPILVPVVEDRKVKGYVNLLTEKMFTYNNGKITESEADLSAFEEYVTQLHEAVATTDEEMMEKFFSGEKFTQEEIIKGVYTAVKAGDIAPVYCGSGYTLEGVDQLLNGISKYAPGANETIPLPATSNGEVIKLSVDENGPLAAIVFKTIADPQVGKRSYFKVMSGKLTADTPVINGRTGEAERVNKLFIVKGGKTEETSVVTAGDIGCVAKLATINTGDTLCAASKPIILTGIDFPEPCLPMCIRPVNRGDEEKIVNGLNRLIEEDPTISQYANTETHEHIVSGLGEQHLDVVVSKLKSKFGVDVTLSTPRVAYRETIRKSVRVQGRHKKQSGGHGQFGDVWIQFAPCDGDDLVFEEKVFGGAVPRNFFPAVEKGLRDCMVKGPLAGYPVVGIHATLDDGSYHPVDSSEMSFKMAAALAFKAAFTQASPTLLEPVGTLKAIVPDDNMGDIMGDINKRRGRVMGMSPAGEPRMQIIEAEVPMAEAGDFSTVLRSVTQGRGSFSLTFERYEEAPQPVVQKVIEEAKARGEIE